MEEHIDLFKKIISKVEEKVDYVDIRAGKGDNNSIIMKDGKIQEVNSGSSLGARIRVLNNGAWGFAYTNDFSTETLNVCFTYCFKTFCST